MTPSELGCLTLKQGVVDENVWKICDPNGEVQGLLIVYVDDLMCLASKDRAQEVWKAVRHVWQATDPVWADEALPLSFCGLEIYQGEDQIWLQQTRYLQELLDRHDVKAEASSPMWKWMRIASPEGYQRTSVASRQSEIGSSIQCGKAVSMGDQIAKPSGGVVKADI